MQEIALPLQTIAKLKRAYPSARIVVVELKDWNFGNSLPSPVKRLMNAGADAYLLADSLDELAGQLSRKAATAPVDETERVVGLAQPSVDELIMQNLEQQLRARREARG